MFFNSLRLISVIMIAGIASSARLLGILTICGMNYFCV
ncbi:Uncharacterized protein YP598_1905 [Yersinia pseudotuberculosis]|uniref:Uncharacterized protein n=1 Tax=Yersinia pseudotuberculosis serotype O:1b (strain IP 31758) TaxID=349747 RepID=A0A0U1R2E9_YERP3|nr:hypothetical protein YpsIP31758_1860 [Yersinia pseudotuberculosis IP 31758]UFA61526.1 Uncharacterized protein YP598_1905 [Yersinia pseudotuberculosis]